MYSITNIIVLHAGERFLPHHAHMEKISMGNCGNFTNKSNGGPG